MKCVSAMPSVGSGGRAITGQYGCVWPSYAAYLRARPVGETDFPIFIRGDNAHRASWRLICSRRFRVNQPRRALRARRACEEAAPTMLKTRAQNVISASWSPNGEALGTVDLTKEDNNPFGQNVFSPAVQKELLPSDVSRSSR